MQVLLPPRQEIPTEKEYSWEEIVSVGTLEAHFDLDTFELGYKRKGGRKRGKAGEKEGGKEREREGRREKLII